MYKCKFCIKECLSKKSLTSHQCFCKSNPDRKDPATWATGNRKGIHSWNAGLFGDPRLKHTEDAKRKMSDKMCERSAEWHIENGKRVSLTINRKVLEGTWHTSLAKHMHVDYNGVDLHGSWELAYAKFLDLNNIKWVRNKDSFLYMFSGKERRYTPDFYLIDTDEYIEIKGYKTEKDDAKWAQFPANKKLRILMHKDLKELNII